MEMDELIYFMMIVVGLAGFVMSLMILDRICCTPGMEKLLLFFKATCLSGLALAGWGLFGMVFG